MLGSKPATFTDLGKMAKAIPDLGMVDVVTDPSVHHTVVCQALNLGLHVLVEKPLAITVKAGRLMMEAAERNERLLSVAENYRRDPINRLAKALLDVGAIGTPRLMQHNTMGGGDSMLISVWRHQKNASGVLLDVGTHFADIMEYYLGEADTAYAQTRLHEKTRKNPVAGTDGTGGSSPAGIYGQWQKDMPAEFEATAEDAAYATVLFKSGAVGQYIEDHAAHGEHLWKRSIHGSLGSLDLPGDRSGQRLTLHRDGQNPVDDQSLLDLVPEYRLDKATAILFGGERLFEYRFPFPETDRKLIAVEYHELGTCIQQGRRPEVSAHEGARAVGLSYSLMESQVAGRALLVDEVCDDQVNAYQSEINEHLGL